MPRSPLRTARPHAAPGVEPGDPGGVGTLERNQKGVGEAVAVEASLDVQPPAPGLRGREDPDAVGEAIQDLLRPGRGGAHFSTSSRGATSGGAMKLSTARSSR
jgi:hypothetical protein